MKCTLDFLTYHPTLDFQRHSDGFLTTEFALLEKYAMASAEEDSHDSFWCDAAQRPELLCLDIGAPSTLGNSLNSSVTGTAHNSQLIFHLQSTANETNTQLFGQTRTCHGRSVGDGVINVFDISTLLSYLFQDWMYSSLPLDPSQVVTVDGREGVSTLCNNNLTRLQYTVSYYEDTCVASHSVGYTTGGSSGRRRSLVSGPFVQLFWDLCDDDSQRKCLYFDRPIHMGFFPHNPTLSFNFEGIDDARVYVQEIGFALSAIDDVMRPVLPGTGRRIVVRGKGSLRNSNVQLFQTSQIPYTVGTLPEQVHSPPAPSLRRSLSLDVPGRWSTLAIPGIPLRLHVVLRGIATHTMILNDEPWHHDAVGSHEVRVTRVCETPEACKRCASIQTSFSNNIAVYHGTLELLQVPIRAACPFTVHLYQPASTPEPTVEYMIVSDSHLYESSAWSHASCVERGLWVSKRPPPPPAAARPAPATPIPPSSSYRATLTIVSVVCSSIVVVLGLWHLRRCVPVLPFRR